jgi:ABC-type sulfate transport system substrate-binding protein
MAMQPSTSALFFAVESIDMIKIRNWHDFVKNIELIRVGTTHLQKHSMNGPFLISD